MLKFRKVTTLLLALVLMLTMVPVSSLAAGPDAPPAAEEPQVAQTPRADRPTMLPDLQISQSGDVYTAVNPLYQDLYGPEDFPEPEFTQGPPAASPAKATYLTEAKIAAELRKHLVNRETKFTIYLKYDNVYLGDVIGRIMEAAMEHTGKPKEGDYLMWQWGNYTASTSWQLSGDTFYHDITFQVNYYTTAEQEQEMNTAVSKLLKTLNVSSKSDYKKVCAVYDYICDNVTYDYANLEDDTYMLKHSAYAALINKTAVCQGYALLFYRLMLELDVDARLLPGIGGGEAHGWNIVELDGVYYNLDSTWDAGMPEYSYFLRNTKNFTNHYRYMEYETFEFHTDYPMARDDYSTDSKGTKDPIIYTRQIGEAVFLEVGRNGNVTISGTGGTDDYAASASAEYIYPLSF